MKWSFQKYIACTYERAVKKKTYSTSEAAKELGVPLRTLRRWMSSRKVRAYNALSKRRPRRNLVATKLLVLSGIGPRMNAGVSLLARLARWSKLTSSSVVGVSSFGGGAFAPLG